MTRNRVAANWKMNLSMQEVYQLLDDLKAQWPAAANPLNPTLLAVPAPYLMAVGNETQGYPQWEVAAQNVHHEVGGAFTGEHSATMVMGVGAKWTILGHSERRQYQQETDELLLKKMLLAHKAGLGVIFCVGETLTEREADQTLRVIEKQVKAFCQGALQNPEKPTILAYEPVWAIGTGKTATPEQAQEVHHFIRKYVATQLGEAYAQQLTLQYGGSVKANNADELFAQPDIDGALVGGASLKASDFLPILEACARHLH